MLKKMLKTCVMYMFISFCLAGCATTASLFKSAPQADKYQYLNKPMKLNKPMFLIETKPLNPINYNGYWLFNFPVTTYYNNYIHANIPTEADFQSNMALWQSWQGTTFSDRARVTAIVPAGTAFHIQDIVSNGNQQNYWVTIQFDEGQYKDSSAMYGNPKELIPTMYS